MNNLVFKNLYKDGLTLSITDGEHGTVIDNPNGAAFLLSSKNIFNNSIQFLPDDRKITIGTQKDLNKRTKLEKGDILLTTVGEIGRSCIIEEIEINFSIQRSIGVIKTNKDKLDPYYLLYVLQSKSYRDYLNQVLNNSIQNVLSIELMQRIDIPFVEIEEQKKRANIFKKIDKKIETNNKIIETLKDKLKTIYSYWFHQFDFPDSIGEPYKSSGGSMVWNQELKSLIPKQWSVQTLKHLVNSISEVPETVEEKDTVDLSIMPQDSITIYEYNSSVKFDTNLKVLYKNSILFGLIRPYLKKCILSPIDGYVTGTVAQFRVINEKHIDIVLAIMTSDAFFQYTNNNSTGTKMPVVKTDQLLEYKFAYDEATFNSFCKINHSHTMIISLLNENKRLKELKEYLLPFILTGFPSDRSQ